MTSNDKPTRQREKNRRTTNKQTIDTSPDEDGIRARFFPDDVPAEVVLTEDDMVWLFTEGHEVSIPLDTCEDIADVIDHIKTVADATEDHDKVVLDIALFTGIFRFLGDVGENSYLNPPGRSESDYGIEDS